MIHLYRRYEFFNSLKEISHDANFHVLLCQLLAGTQNLKTTHTTTLCKNYFTGKSQILTWASRKVSDSRPWVSCRKPVFIIGRNTPVTATWSPGIVCLVISPLAMTVIERGMWPTGTWSLCSWIFISWNFTNLEPRVWRYRRPPALR